MFIAGIFFKRVNSRGIIIGFFTSALMLFFVQSLSNVHFFLYAFTGIVLCCVVGYLGSFLFSGKKANLEGLTFNALETRKTNKV